MNFRDCAERLVWTVIAAFIGGLSIGGILDISTLDAAIAAAATAGVNFILLVARARLAVLPDPGAGLAGLPTRDDGAVQWSVVALVLIAIVAVLWALGEVPR